MKRAWIDAEHPELSVRRHQSLERRTLAEVYFGAGSKTRQKRRGVTLKM